MSTVHHPVDVLIEEHEIIQEVLKAIDVKIRALEAGEPLEESFWFPATGFIVNYVERRHETKEEDLLLPALVECGFTEFEGPLADTCKQHIKARDLAFTMRHACGRGDSKALAEAAKEFNRLLRLHIEHENTVLYPQAREALSDATVAELWEDFIRLDRRMVSELDYTSIACDLCSAAGIEFTLPELAHG